MLDLGERHNLPLELGNNPSLTSYTAQSLIGLVGGTFGPQDLDFELHLIAWPRKTVELTLVDMLNQKPPGKP